VDGLDHRRGLVTPGMMRANQIGCTDSLYIPAPGSNSPVIHQMSYVAKANISFDPTNMYSTQPARRQALIDAVHAYAGPAGSVYATIV
jgi:hypothetical protein